MPNEAPSIQDQAAINAELERILVSDRFVNARKLSKLLRYVVEEALAGRHDRIKAFSIAQDVFGRDSSFDQQRDPIVRVEASRLRKCLDEYYESSGKVPAIRIDIPKGGYAPHFIRPDRTADKIRLLPWRWFALFGLALALALGLGLLVGDRSINTTVRGPTPFLAVMPLSYAADDIRAADLAQSFVDSTITMLARLPQLSVMAHASMMEFEKEQVSIRLLKDKFGVTHILRGNIETRGNELRIRSQLINTDSSETVWSEVQQGELSNIWTLQDELAASLLSALSIELQIADRDRLVSRYTESAEALTLYRQGLFMILPPNESKRVQAARQLFYRVIEIDPEFAGGYVGAAWSFSLPILFNNSRNPGEHLEQAISFAEQAIEVDPRFGAGYVVLGFSQVLSGNPVEAVKNARLAAAIKPGDAFVQFIKGMILIMAGLPEEAIAPLNEAIRLNPLETRAPYLNSLGIARYANGQYQETLDMLARNLARGGPQGPHMDVFRAAAHAQLGNKERATEIVATLNATFPDYPYSPWLASWIGQGEHLQSTLEKLSENGLVIPTD